MILNGCAMMTCGSMSMAMKHRIVTKPNASRTTFSAAYRLPTVKAVAFQKTRNLWDEQKSCPMKDMLFMSGWQPLHLSTSSTTLLAGNHGSPLHTTPVSPMQRSVAHRSHMVPRASSKDVPTSFRFPPMTKKPRWWWRMIACLPYLMPLHETWMYAETAYHLHPFLEDFEFMTYPFLGALGKLPTWFLMAYFFVAYLGVVRKKEWPHFFRFHVVMGMLLEIALQVMGTVSRWMPLAIYWGKVGMHVWTAIAFAFLFTVLECIRCALAGMYADVPFVCDAAYIQIPYD
ncbi:hypothetical protein MKW98_014645 [Papaver atlanticum]|uniref:Protein TIC 20 n=1 Tax=Papaver atlanticum TaxID=357466 RepID=A0AAD4SFC0_9MAGN|nr:hypothetical protein MKW98_014645 [Papaver atlanticum]